MGVWKYHDTVFGGWIWLNPYLLDDNFVTILKNPLPLLPKTYIMLVVRPVLSTFWLAKIINSGVIYTGPKVLSPSTAITETFQNECPSSFYFVWCHLLTKHYYLSQLYQSSLIHYHMTHVCKDIPIVINFVHPIIILFKPDNES